MFLILADIDPKTVETAVIHVEKQPWIAVVTVLSCICAVMLAALIWAARSGLPWMDRRQQSSQDHVKEMMTARGKESERDLAQLTEQLVTKLGGMIERQSDAIGNVRTDLARIAAKIGAAGIVLVLLTGMLSPPPGLIVIHARRPPQPVDLCNPRCPTGQQCMGRICTIRVKPKQPQPTKVADTPPLPPALPRHSGMVATFQAWTDGRDPFERESE